MLLTFWVCSQGYFTLVCNLYINYREHDVLPIIIFAISIVLVQILENILGIGIRNTRPSNKQLKVISEQSTAI